MMFNETKAVDWQDIFFLDMNLALIHTLVRLQRVKLSIYIHRKIKLPSQQPESESEYFIDLQGEIALKSFKN